MPKVRTAILISGRGSNMMSLIEASESETYPASIDLVISNRPDAPGLDKARNHSIKAVCIDHAAYNSRKDFEDAMQAELKSAGIELICCAGFMRVLTKSFTRKWAGRLLNIHPSLLPKYKGLNTHARALEAGDTQHGCTVHYVTAELDSGDVILQETITIETGDTPESLARKVLEKELTLYPRALRLHIEKTVKAT